MAESYNYQLLTGIVKVVRPSNRAVLGVSNGQGGFMWLPTDKIILSHPAQFENWQTTIFAIDPTWKLTWKAEKNWEQYKGSYPVNTKPILQPVPPMFLNPNLAAKVQTQQPQQPVQQPQTPVIQQQIIPPQIAPPHPLAAQLLAQQEASTPVKSDAIPATLLRIAKSLEDIRDLFKLFLKAPDFVSADSVPISVDQVAQEYGDPPDEVDELFNNNNVNKDKLPSIF